MSEEGFELEYIQDAFRKNGIAPLGENVNGFEKAMSAYMGAEHVVALGSGTYALHLAAILAGVGVEDLVFCQDLTFSASANPVAYQGGKPVFADAPFVAVEERAVSDDLFARGVCLPSDTKMRREDVAWVSAVMRGLF